MANQIYFTDGEFYQCATATSAGESPTTKPTKWRRIQIPKRFREVLGELTYARLLEMDGQLDKASVVRNRALKGDGGLDDLVRREVNAERHRNRPEVQSR